MSRRYQRVVEHKLNSRRTIKEVRPVKGVQLIHIGEDVWRAGRVRNKVTETYVRHLVIYGPQDKEHHVYDSDIDMLESDFMKKPALDVAKLKIYILTTILDKRERWCFDTTLLPQPTPGQKLKVIYRNGTIQNIVFSGKWEPLVIVKGDGRHGFNKEVFGYRASAKHVHEQRGQISSRKFGI